MRYSLPFTELQCQWESHPAHKYEPYPPCTRLTLRTSVWGSECASNTREEPKEASNDSFEVDNVAFGGGGVPCNNVIFFYLHSLGRHILSSTSTPPRDHRILERAIPFASSCCFRHNSIPPIPSGVGHSSRCMPSYETQSSTSLGLHDPNIALSHTDHGPFIVGWWTSSKLTDTYLVWGQVALTVPETTTKSYGSPTHA